MQRFQNIHRKLDVYLAAAKLRSSSVSNVFMLKRINSSFEEMSIVHY